MKLANTDIGMPDNPTCTTDEYLDYCKVSDMENSASSGGVASDERETKTLGGHEYRRELWRMTSQGDALVVNYCARRLYDHLTCIIEAQCHGCLAQNPDFCEAWFSQAVRPRGRTYDPEERTDEYGITSVHKEKKGRFMNG